MNIINEEKLKKETEKYNNFLINMVSIIMLTLFFGSLSTDNPSHTARLLSPIAFAILLYIPSAFPPSIKLLQKLSKNINFRGGINEIIRNRIKKFEKELFKSPPGIIFICSYMLYVTIAIFPEWGIAIKKGTILELFGII